MGRSKNAPTEPIELTVPPAEQITAQQNFLARVEGAFSDERDLLNQLLGQAQMAEAFSKFSKTVLVSKLAFVKENKLYQGLNGKKTKDGLEYSGTWSEFCNLLGWTPEHANEAIANLRNFGEEALESMSRMGIGYREMRQYRRLPEDQRAALIEVAKAGDKEAFVELAEEIITKHVKEKEALTARATEAESTLEASRQRSAEKSAELDQVREENIRLTRHHSSIDPIELGSGIREALAREVTRVETEMLTLRKTLTTLVEHGQAHGANHEEYAAGLLCQLQRTLYQLHGEFDIKSAPDSEALPAWMREEPVIGGVAR